MVGVLWVDIVGEKGRFGWSPIGEGKW
jgi:hypothetical protein